MVAITYNSSADLAELVVKSIQEAGGSALAVRIDAADRAYITGATINVDGGNAA
ncbi:hypothetical protein GCM10022226_65560 [Sphaerisporangium flaviroseum]|uniref:Uncharacterized protein n=1 Tax=Sphaerisporangium flaviroseum TaxID=509199 RepID=A0ABP7J5P9_9ACTN